MRYPYSLLAGHIGLIFLISFVTGTTTNLMSPNRIEWVQDWATYVINKAQNKGIQIVNIDQVRAIVESDSHWIFDARPLSDYAAGCIPGALSLPIDVLDNEFEQYLFALTPDQPILVYCSGNECDESLILGNNFIERGFTNIVLYPAGFSEWVHAESRKSP